MSGTDIGRARQGCNENGPAGGAGPYVGSEKATIIVVGNASEFLDDLKAIRPDVEVIEAGEIDFSRTDLMQQEG